MFRLVRIAIAAVFLWAAYAKAMLPLGGPTMYEQWIEAHPALRYLLPGIEAALGVWLLVGPWPRVASILTMLLVSAFSGLVVLEMFKNHPKPCGCMGAVAALYEPSAIRLGLLMDLGRNLLLMAGAYYIALASRAVRKPKSPALAAEALAAPTGGAAT